MTSIFSSHSDAFKLVVDPRPYVAGEHVTGYVDFDPSVGQEEKIDNVKVTLEGGVATRVLNRVEIRSPNGQIQRRTNTYTAYESLVRVEVTLWDEHYGNTGAPGVLRLPFDFVLPQNLPSSYHAWSSSQGGTISYAIEVTADRHGFLRQDKRIAQVLLILPNASPEQFTQAMQIREGWQGPWTTIDRVESVKKHFWSDRSRVEAHLSMPAIPALPIATPIPISLTIVTFTKMMKQSDTPDDAFDPSNHKQLFPAPPTDPTKLELLLRSNVHISARGHTYDFTYEQEHLCGFGKRASPYAAAPLQRNIAKPQWIPGEDGKGCWRREVRYDSQLILQCSPTIETSILQCWHELDIEIPLPGMFNDFEWAMPIKLQSGVTSAPQPHAPEFRVPKIDLPQEYYSGEYHSWNE